MEENKSRINREDDQLRNETTNEVIRNTGNTPNNQRNERGTSISDSETERTSTDASDLSSSSNRSGNTELSNSTKTGSGHDTTQRGSDLTTKKSVTGSDFDGQAI